MHTKTAKSILEEWENHRMLAGDAIENYFGKYSPTNCDLKIVMKEEFDVISPRRPGLVAEGKVDFTYQGILYRAKYEAHQPVHSGADDFYFVKTVMRFPS